MPPIKPEDLPAEIHAILGEAAREGACPDEQPVCQPDVRVTAQLTDDPPPSEVVLPWRISNAQKGDLILAPGGPHGFIGGLLLQLEPPQIFSHMGIMTSDFTEVRQATANPTWMKKFYNGSILGIEPAPTNGFHEDALRHQWPGTVTQSVESAYLTWRDHPVERDSNGEARRYPDGDEIPLSGFSELDETTGRRYHIDSLSFEPKIMTIEGTERLVWPIVVQPCWHQESQFPEIRRALHRVADASKDIHGHYRFYAYTKGDIGGDSAMFGPPRLERMGADLSSECTGLRPLVPLTASVPLQCASLVWQAVQLANERAARLGHRRIVLDGRQEIFYPGYECSAESHLPRNPFGYKVEPTTPDGLYHYDEGDRRRAGEWLYERVVTEVRDSLGEQLPEVEARLGLAAGVLQLGTLLTMLATLPLQLVTTLLGISVVTVKELIVLLSDMPSDTANQMCNAFASDKCDASATDDDSWRHPGTGDSVSPDNTYHAWAPHNVDTSSEIVHGIYGFNDRMRVSPPTLVANPPPPSSWQISQGTGGVQGRVFYRETQSGTEVPVPARVRIGCSSFYAHKDSGVFELGGLPAGKYWCEALYNDHDQQIVMKSAGQVVEVIAEGFTDHFEIELIPPPSVRREIVIEVRGRSVNRRLIGEDRWKHTTYVLPPVYLGLDYFPAGHPRHAEARRATQVSSVAITDFGRAEVRVDLELLDDTTIRVVAAARLVDADDDVTFDTPAWEGQSETLIAPKSNANDGATGRISAHSEKISVEPVHAWTELTIHNNPVTWW
ncbi:hypothetical protein [Sinosporangium siamense]|uniref:Uncharacterized protein n=1 Tax=Sinosporangium siamense TaxID=1367973 RepID=A0A919RNB2_9ACTN|nr:hypothetical protein [Sinosporangium siamense]GII95139.1 hypothetical protein Ssi02_53700 [Sinosporangium siamense]